MRTRPVEATANTGPSPWTLPPRRGVRFPAVRTFRSTFGAAMTGSRDKDALQHSHRNVRFGSFSGLGWIQVHPGAVAPNQHFAAIAWSEAVTVRFAPARLPSHQGYALAGRRSEADGLAENLAVPRKETVAISCAQARCVRNSELRRSFVPPNVNVADHAGSVFLRQNPSDPPRAR